ncbi:putative photosynthetic complex assembly protein PuhE [Rhodovulum euryhalinum]|uniref:Putative photosynthetic complex assembly protein 2 n=1 Tax=Rhodovulum euryhalinum TaxID=35805 RepID=A0A4R2KLZ9_9RHOB|nr:putative photosynthetic complex assembly protein PuhE [Rhodovulum euryhalinum]TCO73567.1 putative photosynthetic complex assembly protein 2 [Rhodovulum euryhalinum]
MIASGWFAALGALFIWWFSTGAILVVVRHAEHRGRLAHLRATILALPLLGGGVWLFELTRHVETVASAYLAFLAAIAIWGWVELAFLTGVITGPNTTLCHDGARGWERFMRAYGTIAYHETLLVVILFVMLVTTQGAPNTVGLWTFIVLFFARISAKLNLFLGVPKINVEFLPTPLAHLPSHFRISKLNWLFPFSVSFLTFAVYCWLERLYSVAIPHEVIGFALLSSITALALLEHWLMVLPLPDERLWRWMLPARKDGAEKAEIRRKDLRGI